MEEQLAREIAGLIMSGDIKDPRVNSFLSVSRVEAAKDLSFAKVYISSFQDAGQLEEGVIGLNSAAKYIQGLLGRKLRLRLTPILRFEADHGVRDGIAIIQKMKGL
jgi:ribosome-binding factor A